MEISRIACIGAGLVGQGWATIFLSRGLEVIMQDISQEILDVSMKQTWLNLKFLETQGLVQKGSVEAWRERIQTTTDIADACGHVDYIQESVPDNYEIKKRVFEEMDAAAPAHVILASSASGLLMTDVQEVTTRPERCVLVHPVLPVHLIPTVEIAGGKKTSPITIQKAREFMERVGKSPVVLRQEVPGYIINRLQAALMREAIDLVDKGIASPEEVDKAFCRGLGLRDPVVGPFLRMHIAGNGIENFLKNYAQSYRYRWETMETWTSIPSSAIDAVINGTRDMKIVSEKSLGEVSAWRDDMLVKILKLMENN
jgi:carnitine 3-dehydrogenase